MIESIPDYQNIVLLMFLVKKDDDLINKVYFLWTDFEQLYEGFRKKIEGTKCRISCLYKL